MIYDLLVIKAKELMKAGDINGYIRTLERMRELKVELTVN